MPFRSCGAGPDACGSTRSSNSSFRCMVGVSQIFVSPESVNSANSSGSSYPNLDFGCWGMSSGVRRAPCSVGFAGEHSHLAVVFWTLFKCIRRVLHPHIVDFYLIVVFFMEVAEQMPIPRPSEKAGETKRPRVIHTNATHTNGFGINRENKRS